jgi:hypothetical protein
MKRLDRVKQILDAAVRGENIGAHGPFWRPLDLAAFKTVKVFGKQLVIPGDGAHSNLVLALRGQSPFGEDLGVPNAEFPRMPDGFPAVADGDIDFIEKWISDGCPDDEVPPPADTRPC